jgi:DNA modification methylase
VDGVSGPELGSLTLEDVGVSVLAGMAAPYNPRKISAHDLSALRRSMRTFGVVEPVVVNRRTNRIVGGHQRVRAAQAEKMPSLPVAYVDLDETAERQLNLALNRIHGEWDDEKLQALLEELRAGGADLDLTGFENAELDRLIGSLAGLTDPDEAPLPPKIPAARPGDLVRLGPHRLLCGSSTNQEDVARLLGDAAPRLMLTDPPYGVSYDARWRDVAGHNEWGASAESNRHYMRSEEHRATKINGDTIADWSPAFELVKSLDYAYIWHASSRSLQVLTGLERIGWEVAQQIIWLKPVLVLSRQHYHWRHEPAFYARKKGARVPWRGSRDQTTVWEANSPKVATGKHEAEDGKVDHPTQKPVALYTRPIENHLERGEPFYEPFAGSGSAFVAAEMTGRVALGMEIDPAFIDVVVRRWQDFTGKKAEGWRGNA